MDDVVDGRVYNDEGAGEEDWLMGELGQLRMVVAVMDHSVWWVLGEGIGEQEYEYEYEYELVGGVC
jgi:hypothetical protein